MDGVDYAAWRFWLDGLQWLTTIAVGIYVFLSNRNRVTHDRISRMRSEVDERMDDHGERIAELAGICAHHPKHGDLSKVYDRIKDVDSTVADLGAGVADLKGEVKGMSNTLTLINQHLINQGDR